jgi:hypothetical protein
MPANLGEIRGTSRLKEYECVQVGNHKDIAKTTKDWQGNGWRLHTYQVTGRDIWISHYLLFEREKTD